MMFIPVPGKVNYTQGSEYSPTSLPSYIQKMKQKLVATNINNKTMGHVPYIYKVRRNRDASCDYTHTGSSRKEEVTLECS
jgi:hypothetical protein